MPPAPHRVSAINIVPYLPDPVKIAKDVTTPLEAFELFFFFDKTITKTNVPYKPGNSKRKSQV